jgi:phosphoribosyl 1,2-cyclic phosphodiesterase
VLAPRTPARIRGITFEAFPVVHSLIAPAVGLRITAGRARIFYVPDLVYIPDRAAALKDVDVYVGDGATLVRPLVRRRGDTLIGHAAVRTQLGWCAREGVPRAIITHCGSQIVTADAREVAARVRAMGEERGVRAEVARDGLVVRLP